MSEVLDGALGLLLGAIAGSFVATLLIRWPEGRSAARGRSRCDSCGEPLRAPELVPLVSFAVQRGRCRRCGAAIDRRHAAVELAAAAIGLLAFLAHGLPLGLVTACLGWWLLLVACLDFEHHWLPDRLTLPLVAAGLAAAWAGLGPPLIVRTIGAAAGFAGLWLIARTYRGLRGREGMGAGDPKLFAAIGAWLGWTQLPFVLLGAALLGLAAAALMHARGKEVTGSTALPLGSLLAIAAWPLWLVAAAHSAPV